MSVPQNIAEEVLFRNRHTCCICGQRGKDVQIHHIDGNSSHNSIENLAVLCLDCHSKVTSDGGLGRRFLPHEVQRYKSHWEAINRLRVERSESLARNIRAELLKADISRLMIEALSLRDQRRRLEAVEQLEAYGTHFPVRRFVLQALDSIAVMYVWSDAGMTGACAEGIHHLFWRAVGPEGRPWDADDQADAKVALDCLDLVARRSPEHLRSVVVLEALFESLGYFYYIAVGYGLEDLGMSVLQVAEVAADACCSTSEEGGGWTAGVDAVLGRLERLKGQTPKGWEEHIKAIDVIVAKARRGTVEARENEG